MDTVFLDASTQMSQETQVIAIGKKQLWVLAPGVHVVVNVVQRKGKTIVIDGLKGNACTAPYGDHDRPEEMNLAKLDLIDVIFPAHPPLEHIVHEATHVGQYIAEAHQSMYPTASDIELKEIGAYVTGKLTVELLKMVKYV